MFARLGLVQIDSVNALVRSHYLPFFSRAGPYDRALLEALSFGKRRTVFEYWGHEASLIDLELHPLLRWRMARAERGDGTWGRVAGIARERPAFVQRVHDEVRRRGPVAAGDIAEHRRGGGPWWDWSDVKIALEYLFWSGAVTTAARRNFERLYDVPERVFDAHVLARPTPPEADAQRALVLHAARALGVATESDLRDYFRLDLADARARVGELADAGELLSVAVEGWKQRAYVVRGTVVPRRLDTAVFVSPFDSLVWNRPRDARLFGFDYRLEIYTPAHKRVHGYYVLPFAYGDTLVARVDLRARRSEGTLDAVAVHYERRRPAVGIRDALQRELHELARWLGLERIRYAAARALRP
ncbi:MAG: winged helix-turn-helix domain-containing protein [Candidatus Velthaea sp.]